MKSTEMNLFLSLFELKLCEHMYMYTRHIVTVY